MRLGTWARDGFADDLAEGRLTRDQLQHVLDRFAPIASTHLLACRVTTEAAVALGRIDAGYGQCWHPAFGRARSIAQNLRESGRYDRSLRFLEGAREMLPRGNPYEPYLLQALAVDTRALGQYDRTLELIEAALAGGLPPAHHGQALRAYLLTQRAGTYVDMGLPDLAAEPVEEAFAGVDAMDALRPVVDTWGPWLAAHRVQADMRTATDRFELLLGDGRMALDFARQTPRPLSPGEQRDRARLILSMGIAAMELGETRSELLATAEGFFRTTLDEDLNDPLAHFDCETRLAWIALTRGEAEACGEWLERASARAELTPVSPRRMAFLAALETQLALATGIGAGRLEAIRDQLEEAIGREIGSWMTHEPRPGGLAWLRYSDRRYSLGALLDLIIELEGEERGPTEALRALQRVGATGTLLRRLGAASGGLEAARDAVVPEGGGALVYFPCRGSSHLFVVDRERVTHSRLSSEWPLWNAARELDRILMRDTEGMQPSVVELRAQRLEELSRFLADELLPAPVADRVRAWTTVTIVGGELLGDPDFALLPLGGEPLGLTKPVTHLTSLGLGHALSRRSNRPAHPGGQPRPRRPVGEPPSVRLVASVPVGGRMLPELPLSEAEARRLCEPFGGRVDLVLDDQTTAGRIAEDLGSFDLLAILSHGLRDPAAERSSQILVRGSQGDDALDSDDVERLPSPPVVFLGVCASGRGPSREGAGPVAHLGGAFLLAGASAVVLSDADLAYGPTLALTEAFLEHAAKGATPAEALLSARRRVVEAGWNDPRDWALVRALGLAHRGP